MNRALGTITLSASVLLVSGQGPFGCAEAAVYVQDGKPACSIVVAEKPSPAARLAALEVQYHIMKITAANFGGNRTLISE